MGELQVGRQSTEGGQALLTLLDVVLESQDTLCHPSLASLVGPDCCFDQYHDLMDHDLMDHDLMDHDLMDHDLMERAGLSILKFPLEERSVVESRRGLVEPTRNRGSRLRALELTELRG